MCVSKKLWNLEETAELACCFQPPRESVRYYNCKLTDGLTDRLTDWLVFGFVTDGSQPRPSEPCWPLRPLPPACFPSHFAFVGRLAAFKCAAAAELRYRLDGVDFQIGGRGGHVVLLPTGRTLTNHTVRRPDCLQSSCLHVSVDCSTLRSLGGNTETGLTRKRLQGAALNSSQKSGHEQNIWCLQQKETLNMHS